MSPRLLSALILLPCAIPAQDTPKLAHIVRASGEATVNAKPDRAQISIGVLTQAVTAQAASAQNATQTTTVLNILKPTLGPGGQLKTTGYSLSPDYQYPKDGGPPKLIGYRASNTVLVTVDDLSLLGKIIDTATHAGANDINGIAFMLRNDEAVRSQALAEAASKARASAEAIAEALNLRVVGIMDAEATEAPTVRPLFREAMKVQAAAAPTPVEAGTLDIRASVVVSLQVEQAAAPESKP
jgi:uncharacterized protein YggE